MLKGFDPPFPQVSFGELGIQIDGSGGILDGFDITFLPDEGLSLAGV